MFHLRLWRFSAIILFLLLLTVPFMISNTAQAGAANPPAWYWQNPLPQGNGLMAVSAADTSTAWAVGRYGTIIKTADGGTTWLNQESGTKVNYLYDVSAVDSSTAWAVGAASLSGAVITKTTDGSNWSLHTPPTDKALRAVFALDSSTAWAVGLDGTVIKTTDGSNWLSQDSGVNSDIRDVSAADADNVWAVGLRYSGTSHYPVILKSGNGGATWSHQDAPAFLSGITAVDESTAWAVGVNGTILKTADGGQTWLAQNSGTTNYLVSVVSASRDVAWAFGRGGTILRTTDGTSWSKQTSGISEDIGGSTFAGGTTAWAVGDYNGINTNSTFILKTSNGTNWNRQDSGSREGWADVSACSPGTAWAAKGAYTVQSVARTIDGGATWSPCNTPLGVSMHRISAVDDKVAWAAGGRTVLWTNYMQVYRTTNGGLTWETRYSIALNPSNSQYGAFMSVEAVDAETAYVGGGYNVGPGAGPMYFIGLLMKTTDGGANWGSLATGVSTYDSISAVSNDTAWVHGSGWEQVLAKKVGGTTVYQNYPAGLGLAAVSGVDATTAWAVGENGVIIKTVNGLDWFQQASGTTIDLTSVSAVDSSTAYACGSTGNQPGRAVMLKTEDGGTTWTEQNAWSYRLGAVSAVDSLTAWAVGENGAILHTTDGWVPGFRVSGITPGAGVQDTVVNVTNLSGAQFEEGASVRLERSATQEVRTCQANLRTIDSAINTYYADNHEYPDTVEELVPVYLKQVPSCPLGGIYTIVDGEARCSLGHDYPSFVISAGNVAVVSGDRITCTLDLKGAPLGKYDVVVRNPGGEEARLAAGFSVTNICGGGAGVSVGFFGLLMGLLSIAGAGRLRGRISLRRFLKR